MKISISNEQRYIVNATAFIREHLGFQIATNHNSDARVISKKIPSYATDMSYLKPCDTAVIAYYMMGYGNF